MAHDDAAPLLRIEVAFSAQAGAVQRKELMLPAGASVRDALEASGWLKGVDLSALALGVWGKLRGLEDVLRDQDRVEIYRPLKVDPKEARRQRYRAHKAQGMS